MATVTKGTAPELRLLEKGRVRGTRTSLANYQVREDATPLSILGIGGVSSVTFEGVEDERFDGTPALRNQMFELFDPNAGVQRGVVDSVRVADDGARIDGVAETFSLVARKFAAPYTGTLYGAFTYYFSLGGVTSGIQVDASANWIYTTEVTLPSWNAYAWTQIRKLAVIHGLEVQTVAGVHVLRGLRLREMTPLNTSGLSLSYGNGEAASEVVVAYTTKEWKTNSLFFPPLDQPITDRNILTVGASEVVTTNYSVDVFLTSVNQPQQVLTQPSDPTGSVSSYSVVDRDGVPITVAQWANMGGYLTVAIGADGKSIDVTVRGGSSNSRAPYRIASSSQDGLYQYGSLYVTGTGTFTKANELRFATGADPNLAPADSVVRVEDDLISTHAQAVAVGVASARERAGFSADLSFTTTAVNRRGETGVPLYITFNDYDAILGTSTFAQFDAANAGKTFAQFDEGLSDYTSGDFANQAFGGVGGAYMRYRDQTYRIDSANISRDSYAIQASPFTSFDEFDDAWDGLTFADFDLKWAETQWSTFEVSPLSVLGMTFINLATNPSFESVGASFETHRNFLNNPRANGTAGYSAVGVGSTIAAAPTEGYEGVPAIAVTTSGAATSEGVVITSISPPSMPGKSYAGGIMIKAPVGANFYIATRTAGSVSEDSVLVTVTGTGRWQWYAANPKVAQADATVLQLHVRSRTTPQAVTFHVARGVLAESSRVLTYSDYFDGVSTPRRRVNLCANPAPSSLTGWSLSATSSLTDGWASTTLAGTTVPYIFTGLAQQSFGVGELVTLAVEYVVDVVPAGNAAQFVTVRPHKRTGNVYYAAAAQTRPIVVGQVERVVIQWTTTEALPMAELDVALVGASAADGTFGSALVGFKWRARRVVIENGHTDGSWWSATENLPSGFTAGWEGTVNNSASYQQSADFTPAWVGSPTASNSTLSAAAVNGVAVANAAQGAYWSTSQSPFSRSRAMRFEVRASSPVGIPIVAATPTAGTTYTLLCWVRPMTRPLVAQPRVRGAVGPLTTYPLGVWTEVRLTVPAGSGAANSTGFVLPSGAGHQPGDIVDIDAVVLTEGTYSGPSFDGSTPNTADVQHRWLGATDASQSIKIELN